MSTTHYDPDLPFLAELEQRVRAAAEESERAHRASRRAASAAASASAKPRMRPMGRTAARITRRTAILVALLCLVGATAFGARSVLFSSAPSPLTAGTGSFVSVASGRYGSDVWSMRLYTHAGELCRVLTVLPQEEASGCAPAPSSGVLNVSDVTSILRRYVFGVAGASVRSVSVHAGENVLMLPTHALDAGQARTLGVPPSTRYFMGVLRRPLDEPDPPAFVTGLSAARRRLGAVHVECIQEVDPPPCGP